MLLFFGTLHAQKNIYVSTNGNANALTQQLASETAKDIIRQSDVFLPSEQLQDIILLVTINKTNNAYECSYQLTQASNQFKKTVKNEVTDISNLQSTMTKDVNSLLIALLMYNPGQETATQPTTQPVPQSQPTTNYIQQNVTTTNITPSLNYHEFKVKVRKEKGAFLGMESMAFKKYQAYKGLKAAGWASFSAGLVLLVPVGVPVYLLNDGYSYSYGYYWWTPVPGIVCMSVGGGLTLAGIVMLCCMNSQLHRSYQYYIQGQKRELSMDFHPTFGNNSSVGLGLTMRF